MNLGKEKQILVVDDNQISWLFFFGEDQKICYRKTESRSAPLQEGVVTEHPVVDFWVGLSEDHMVHLLIYTLSRFLIYMSSADGREWKTQTLSRVNLRSQALNDLFILAKDDIHILYVVQNSFRRSNEAIVHYIWDGKEWQGKRVWEFASEDCTRMLRVIPDRNEGLLMFFSQCRDEIFELMYSRFHSDGHWTPPSLLYSSQVLFQHFDALIDSEGGIHCCWDADHQIYHNGIVISKQDTRNTSPCFTYEEGLLTALWLQDGSPVQYQSGDLGKTWESEKLSISSRAENFYLLVAYPEEESRLPHQILSTPFPHIELFKQNMQNVTKLSREAPRYIASVEQIIEREPAPRILDQLEKLQSKQGSFNESINQHTYRLQQLEEKVFNQQRSLFNLDAQIKKILVDVEKLQSGKDQIEAIKMALQSMERQLHRLK